MPPGIKPIIGIEAYMAAESRLERPLRRGRLDDTGGDADEGDKLYYHLTLLAENDQGYKNLLKLSSDAYLSGYWYKPRSDWQLLEKYHEGVIATTGCLGGLVSQALLRGDVEQATAHAARLQEIFGKENLFVELQDHGLEKQRKTNPQLVEIAHRIGAPLLATNDSHYTSREDHLAHDALLCVQTGSTMDDEKRFRFDGAEHYLKTAAEMRALFSEVPEACDNTLWVAERADVTIELGKPKLPAFPLPEGMASSDEYLRHLTFKGAEELYGTPGPRERRRAARLRARRHRLNGFLRLLPGRLGPDPPRPRAEDQGGAGPGSAAGCCVAYCLRIVDLDPIRYDLLFERFLNPGRKQMPDIDMDFDERYRGEMIRYASERWGWDHVAQIRHVLDHQGPSGRAGRGPGARLPLRPRRPHRQGHAPTGDGPGHAAVGLLRGRPQARRRLQGGHRAAGDVRHRPGREARGRRGQGPRRACAARTVSMPRRW